MNESCPREEGGNGNIHGNDKEFSNSEWGMGKKNGQAAGWFLHNSWLFESDFPQIPEEFKCWWDQSYPIVTSKPGCNSESQSRNFDNYFAPSRAGQGVTSVTPRRSREDFSALNLCPQRIIFSRRDKRTLMGWTNWSGQQAPWSHSHKTLISWHYSHAGPRLENGLKASLIRSLIYMTIPCV